MNYPFASDAAKTVHLLGNLITFRGRASHTEGSFSLVDVRTAPGAGTPPHLQRDDQEAFYVLEGEYEFMRGGDTFRGGPGTFVFVPRGVPHAFSNPGSEPARMLIINLPGGLHEGFFEEAGDIVPSNRAFPPAGAPDLPRLGAAAERVGIEFLPPKA